MKSGDADHEKFHIHIDIYIDVYRMHIDTYICICYIAHPILMKSRGEILHIHRCIYNAYKYTCIHIYIHTYILYSPSHIDEKSRHRSREIIHTYRYIYNAYKYIHIYIYIYLYTI